MFLAKRLSPAHSVARPLGTFCGATHGASPGTSLGASLGTVRGASPWHVPLSISSGAATIYTQHCNLARCMARPVASPPGTSRG
eukprot:8954090-Pyramimonas_sp.AAC.1